MLDIIQTLAEKSDSFYIYDRSKILEQTARLKKCFPGVTFLYSVKCNPNRDILKTVLDKDVGFGADAASPAEVRLALEAGLSKEQIYFSAPGKSMKDLKEAINCSVIIADSLSEIARISEIAVENETVGRHDDIVPEKFDAGDAADESVTSAEPGKSVTGTACEEPSAAPVPVEIGLRINPDFSMNGGAGQASKFGIDEQDVYAFLKKNEYKNIKVTGIHVHLNSQVLDLARLSVYYEKIIRIVYQVESLLGYPLSYVNMGSGIGIAYSAQDKELNLELLGAKTMALLKDYRETHPDTKIMIETGRYVVCQSGTYVTHVADKKISHGITYVVLLNTLNGFIRPSLARLVLKYAQEEEPAATEPLYTESNAFAIEAPYPERETERVTVVGNLCTAADVIAEGITLPKLQAGDLVTINNAGAYARVLSPMQFSSHGVVEEYLI